MAGYIVRTWGAAVRHPNAGEGNDLDDRSITPDGKQSFVAEGVDGVDLGGATRGEGAGEQGGDG